MRYAALFAVLVFVGCDRPCVTPCGVVLDKGRCDGLSEREDDARMRFDVHVVGWTESKTCAALEGVHIIIRSDSTDGGFNDAWGRRVGGLYLDKISRIEVASDDWTTNALMHEMAHRFEARIDERTPALDHIDWEERGIWSALRD